MLDLALLIPVTAKREIEAYVCVCVFSIQPESSPLGTKPLYPESAKSLKKEIRGVSTGEVYPTLIVWALQLHYKPPMGAYHAASKPGHSLYLQRPRLGDR